MKSLTTYINERLIINQSFKGATTITVKSKQQLQDIIYDRLGENPEELDLNDLDVSSINDFSDIFSSYLFSELRKTKRIHIEEWNTENATDMTDMFQMCINLEEVDVSNFDVSDVVTMDYMFRKCKSLKELDLTHWKVNRVRDMEKMFYDCESLETIGDVSGWRPESLKIFNNAFNGCKVLKNVDTSKWSDYFDSVSSTDAFYGCPYIQIPDWAEK